MVRVRAQAVLLFALAHSLLPLRAAETSVTLSVCNAGKVDFDVFVVKNGQVSTKHVKSRSCEQPYLDRTGDPAFLGFALVDAKGQWGAVRRYDFVPDLGFSHRDFAEELKRTLNTQIPGLRLPGPKPGPQVRIVEAANQSFSVRRGNADVSLPMQFLFRPSLPVCQSHSTSTYSAAANLPLNATPSQRRAAQLQDSQQRNANLQGSGPTTCDAFVYAVSFLADGDTRELNLVKGCADCANWLTPHSPEQPNPLEQPVDDTSAQPLAWNNLLAAMTWNRRFPDRPMKLPKKIIIRGTVSGVDVRADTFEKGVSWVDVYFKESPEVLNQSGRKVPNIDVCSSRPDIFQDMFGPDFRSTMVGKALEVEGEFPGGGDCRAWQGNLRVTLAHQVRVIAAVRPIDVNAPPLPEPPKITSPNNTPTASDARPSTADYDALSIYLAKTLGPRAETTNVTEDGAQYAVIDYCKTMNDLTPLTSLMSNDEMQATLSRAGQDQAKAKVRKCIAEFDLKAISASRKASLEYCLKTHNYAADARERARYDSCMNENDILLAMCTQAQRLKWAYSFRDNPSAAGPAPACNLPLGSFFVQRIVSSPGTASATPVPAFLLTVPAVPKRPAEAPVAAPPIPNGTVVQVMLTGPISAEAIQRSSGAFFARADRLIQAADGKEIITPRTTLTLKARVLGPGPQPNTIRIALTLVSYLSLPDAKIIPLASDEIVRTIGSSYMARVPGIDSTIAQGTRMAFTLHQ